MNLLNIKAATRYFTSDGASFAEKSAAQSHESLLMRAKALQGVTLDADTVVATDHEPLDSGVFIRAEDLPKIIAANADAILAALVVKKAPGRGRKSTAIPS